MKKQSNLTRLSAGVYRTADGRTVRDTNGNQKGGRGPQRTSSSPYGDALMNRMGGGQAQATPMPKAPDGNRMANQPTRLPGIEMDPGYDSGGGFNDLMYRFPPGQQPGWGSLGDIQDGLGRRPGDVSIGDFERNQGGMGWGGGTSLEDVMGQANGAQAYIDALKKKQPGAPTMPQRFNPAGVDRPPNNLPLAGASSAPQPPSGPMNIPDRFRSMDGVPNKMPLAGAAPQLATTSRKMNVPERFASQKGVPNKLPHAPRIKRQK